MFRVGVNRPEEGIQRVKASEGAVVEPLRHHNFKALIGRAAHNVHALILRNRITAKQQFNAVLVPERVGTGGVAVEEGHGRSGRGRNDFDVLILKFRSGRGRVRANHRRRDRHGGAAVNRDDTEGLQLAGGLLGDLVHAFDTSDGKARTSGHASGGRDSHLLGAVVNVVAVRVERTGNEADKRAVGGNRHGRVHTSDADSAIALERLKARNHADIRTLVGIVRLAVAERTVDVRKVASEAVVVTSVEHDGAIFHRHTLLVHDVFGSSHVVIGARSASDRNNQRALKRGGVANRGVNVRGEALIGSGAQTVFLKRITQFKSSHVPRHVTALVKARRNGQLGDILRGDSGADGAALRGQNVRHRTPDGVVCTLHQLTIGAILGNLLGLYESVVKAAEDVLKRDPFLFTKEIGHFTMILLYGE